MIKRMIVGIVLSAWFGVLLFTVSPPSIWAALPIEIQSANKVLAGPVSGAAGPAIFRFLVASDIPAASGTGGTVTAISAAGNNGITVSGTNLTTTPLLTIGLGNITPINVSAASNVAASGYFSGAGTWLSGMASNLEVQSAVTLAATPANCGAGNYATGINANGSAVGCAAASGGGTVISVSGVPISGLTWSINNATTTPTITITFGSIIMGTWNSAIGSITLALSNVWTALQNFVGSTTTGGMAETNAMENWYVNSISAPQSTQTMYAASGLDQYFSVAASGNWIINETWSGSTQASAVVPLNSSITWAMETVQGATAYYSSQVQIDGVSQASAVWQGGVPTAGNSSGHDFYVCKALHLTSATWNVGCSQTQFK